MRISLSKITLLLGFVGGQVAAFSTKISLSQSSRRSPLICQHAFVSVGLGPEETKGTGENDGLANTEMVAGVDYEIPDHEAFRTSRRSKIDEQCDLWFGTLLGDEVDMGVLTSLAKDARKILLTPVPLINDLPKPKDHEEWTPYVTTKLPWTPLTPAYGLEEYGLPIPRRGADTWRQFDVVGLVNQDYSASPEGAGTPIKLSDEEVIEYKKKLEAKGGWLSDATCQARLVYINGRFTPQLSKTTDSATNLDSLDGLSDEVISYLARLTDGFTDQLAVPVPVGGNMFWSSHKALSGPDHCVGDPTSQFAINTQQGTACFAALNTIRTGGVAFVNVRAAGSSDNEPEPPQSKPVLVVNAVTRNGGAAAAASSSSVESGVSFHPRCLVVAGENSTLSLVQSCVDLDKEGQEDKPTFFNGYSQLFIKANANVTHSYLEETGGLVTAGVEKSDVDVEEGKPIPREVESQRPALKDTHFEIIDVHCMGKDARYDGTIISVGGSGRTRISQSVSLLQPGAYAKINGFALSGGAQRTDCKTNIHHIAQGTTSRQVQKNLIGGRATGSFRGRIRVEQSAQQTDSQQLSRSVLLSDKSRAWTVPSLEIIADDVQCTHGATVADLSEEELFYLRSRGLDRTMSRNLLMYAFASDVCSCAEPAMRESVDSAQGLQQRLIQRLQNVVPQGDRAIQGEFQSS